MKKICIIKKQAKVIIKKTFMAASLTLKYFNLSN